MTTRGLLPLLAVLVLFTGCRKFAAERDYSEAHVYSNIAYDTYAMTKLDMYVPANRTTNTPVVILVHGGSWYSGDKAELAELARYFQANGLAAATINYRLTDTAMSNTHPAQVNDIGKAIEFLVKRTEDWGHSDERFVLMGASAGAHLSLLYTYAYDGDKKIKSVISLAGPADFTDTRLLSAPQALALRLLLGGIPAQKPDAYTEASPVTHVQTTSAPTLLFHGKNDAVVPYQQSVGLKTRLDQFAVKNKLVLYENTGHEVINNNNRGAFLAECLAWIKENNK